MADGIAALLTADEFDTTAFTSWRALGESGARPFDVAVLDLHLADGVLIGSKVRTLAEHGTRAVVLSRVDDPAAATTAMRAGAHAFVPKSADAGELAAAIRAAAASADVLGSEVVHDEAGPALGRQEERAIVHYASGMSIREVAHAMSTTEETVKSYIKRGRRKFRDAGIDIGTRALLRQYAAASGWRLH